MSDAHPVVAIRSFRRAGAVATLRVVPWATVWVPEAQGAAYRAAHPDATIRTIPDAEDGNLARKNNAILDRMRAEGIERFVVMDDDVTGMGYFSGGVKYRMAPAQVARLIVEQGAIAEAVGARVWGVNQNPDEMAYKVATPFAMLHPILGPFVGHIRPELRYEPSVLGKDDYDFWLQNIARYHRSWRVNGVHYFHGHGDVPGGFVSMRTRAVEEAGVRRMIERWGPRVFAVGGSAGARRDRERNPRGNVLNSKVEVPIHGC